MISGSRAKRLRQPKSAEGEQFGGGAAGERFGVLVSGQKLCRGKVSSHLPERGCQMGAGQARIICFGITTIVKLVAKVKMVS
jgi:hypothetical protein